MLETAGMTMGAQVCINTLFHSDSGGCNAVLTDDLRRVLVLITHGCGQSAMRPNFPKTPQDTVKDLQQMNEPFGCHSLHSDHVCLSVFLRMLITAPSTTEATHMSSSNWTPAINEHLLHTTRGSRWQVTKGVRLSGWYRRRRKLGWWMGGR